MYLVLSLSLMLTSIVYAAFSDMLSAERFFQTHHPDPDRTAHWQLGTDVFYHHAAGLPGLFPGL